MHKQTFFIQNREGLKISVTSNINKSNTKLVFVMHGLLGSQNQTLIKKISQTFKNKDFNVISFDTTNSNGKSDGDINNACVKNYYNDLEDVINWASTQDWYSEPFTLIGHSVGGFSVAFYAEKYPQKVCALELISPFISGLLSLEAYNKIYMYNPQKIEDLPFAYFEGLGYTLFSLIENLIMPVIIIIGEKDRTILPNHARILYESLPGKKEFHIIKNAPHTFRNTGHLKEINRISENWINKVLINKK
jgi:pimeloyl-ACP methyl ester carboxylesterase